MEFGKDIMKTHKPKDMKVSLIMELLSVDSRITP